MIDTHMIELSCIGVVVLIICYTYKSFFPLQIKIMLAFPVQTRMS